MCAVAVQTTPTTAPAGARRPRRKLGTAWVGPEEMEHPEWVATGHGLGEMARVNNWWLGDWVNYGTKRWGEKYAEASQISGCDAKTLRNIACIARRFPASRRRDKLSYSHHVEVSHLTDDEQELWLDRAINEQLSVADLRVELRSALRSPKPIGMDGESDPSDASDETSATCPNCGQLLPSSLLLTASLSEPANG
jgi:hypothetical protein